MYLSETWTLRGDERLSEAMETLLLSCAAGYTVWDKERRNEVTTENENLDKQRHER
jgi:hypothetical protein